MVNIYEVGPRDGLQGLDPLPTNVKIGLIDRLSDTGLKYIESVSFVNPHVIPQMADSLDVINGISRRSDVTYSALIPSLNYYSSVVQADLPEINVFISANEKHNKKNLNTTISNSLISLEPLIDKAISDGRKVRAYVSTVFGYEYMDDTSIQDVIDISRWFLSKGVYQVSLGDTTGLSTVEFLDVTLLSLAFEMHLKNFALHLHTSLDDMEEKISLAYRRGIKTFDSAIGGLGGCPADSLIRDVKEVMTGNIDTYDLVKFFENEGVDTGVDLDKLKDVSDYLKKHI